jgi:bacteriocin-like protein
MQKQKKPLVLKPDSSVKQLTTTELDKVVGGGQIPRLGNSGSGGGTSGLIQPETIN